MDLRDPNVIKALIDREYQNNLSDRLSNLQSRSALGQIQQLQGQVMDLAGNKLPAPLMTAVGAGLNAITSGLDQVFGLGPRQTQIDTAHDMARMSAISTVRYLQRQAIRAEREALTEETLRREGVSSLAELRPITLQRRKERAEERRRRGEIPKRRTRKPIS